MNLFSGQLLPSRVTNDVDTIGQSLNQSLGNLVQAVVLFAGSKIGVRKINIALRKSEMSCSFLTFLIASNVKS